MKTIATFVLALAAGPAAVSGAWIVGSIAFFPWTPIDFDEGGRLFSRRCASCHLVSSDRKASFGPNLHQIGSDAAKRIAGVDAEEYLLQSILQPQAFRAPGSTGVMPADIVAGLKPSDIVSIVGFLLTKNGKPEPRRLTKLVEHVSTSTVDEDDIINFTKAELGRQVFFEQGKCATCHILKDLPTAAIHAPSLINVGRHTAEYLEKALLDPNAEHARGFESIIVTLKTGRVVTGNLVFENQDVLVILNHDTGHGEPLEIALHEIDFDGGKPYTRGPSTMPDNYRHTLARDEIDAVVYFMKTLKYARY